MNTERIEKLKPSCCENEDRVTRLSRVTRNGILQCE